MQRFLGDVSPLTRWDSVRTAGEDSGFGRFGVLVGVLAVVAVIVLAGILVQHVLRRKKKLSPPGVSDDLDTQEPREGEISSRQLDVGSEVSLTFPRRDQAFDATMVETGPREFTVETDEALRCRADEECTVRYSLGAAAWEFSARVVRSAPRRVTFFHAPRARLINRRRFHRVPVDWNAHVAMFRFVRNDSERDIPTFVSARLLEIGGPGLLLLRSTLPGHVGDRVLVVFRTASDRLIQAVGRIRRFCSDDSENSLVGVELVGLTPEEMAELIRQTNLAAMQAAREQEAEETVEEVELVLVGASDTDEHKEYADE